MKQALFGMLIAFSACSEIPYPEECVNRCTLKIGIQGKKSKDRVDEDAVSKLCCFIFDRDGMLVARSGEDVRDKYTFELPEGSYSYCISAGDIPQDIHTALEWANSPADLSYNIHNSACPGFNMSGQGTMTLNKMIEGEVNANIERSCSKICLHSIRWNGEGMFQYGQPQSLTLKQVFLMDVRRQAMQDGSPCEDSPLINVWNGNEMSFCTGSLAECTVRTCNKILEHNIAEKVDIGLYCSPSDMTSLVIAAEVKFTDRNTRLWYYRIPVECKPNFCYGYSVCLTGPGADSPVESPPVPCKVDFKVRDWEERTGSGYEDCTDGAPEMSFELNMPEAGEYGSLTFNSIYGDASVVSDNEEVVKCTGCGKNWLLFGIKESPAFLDISDGYNRRTKKIYVGSSIRWRFEDIYGGQKDSIYEGQKACCVITQSEGATELVSYSGLESIEKSEDRYTVVPSSDAAQKGAHILLRDEMMTKDIGIPVKGWSLYACGPYPEGPFSIQSDTELCVEYTLPFDVERELGVPIFVSVNRNHQLKYGILAAYFISGNTITVRVTTTYKRSVHVSIPIILMVGKKNTSFIINTINPLIWQKQSKFPV